MSKTADRSNVARSDSSVLIVAAAVRESRQGVTIHNDSDADLYIALGSAAASTTSFTAKLAAGSYWESPYDWDGAITGIWASAGEGAARVTEVR